MLNRQNKPELNETAHFVLPEFSQVELPNSLNIYFCEKNDLPIVQLLLIVPAGSIYNNSRHGLSYLTSMLIDEGAAGQSGLELSDELEILGSILNISSNKEFVNISLLSLKENFERSVEILSKIVITPDFNEKDFQRERGRLESHIIHLNDNPSYIASAEFQKIIYENTPYEHAANGMINSIPELRNEDVKNFYKTKYTPKGSSLIVVGDITQKYCEDLCIKYFAEWQNNPPAAADPINISQTNRKILLLNNEDFSQSEIRVGHVSKNRLSEDFFARTLLNSILGGQFSSRINLNLREDKGYTYGAHSNYIYNRIASTFLISTSVNTKDGPAALMEIISELELIRKSITAEEMEFSKSYLIRRFPGLFETYAQICNNIGLIPMYDLGDDYYKNYTSNISKATLNDLKTAADENIKLNNLAAVVVGNLSNELAEFEKLAELKGFSITVRKV